MLWIKKKIIGTWAIRLLRLWKNLSGWIGFFTLLYVWLEFIFLYLSHCERHILFSYLIVLLVLIIFFLYRMRKRDRARETFMRVIEKYNMQIALWKDEEDVLSTDKKNELKSLEEEKLRVVQFFQELIWLSLGSSDFRNSNFIATFFC